PAVSRKASRAPATIAIGIVVLVIAAFLIARSRSPRQESTSTMTVPAAGPMAAPAPETRSLAPAGERTPAPRAIALAPVQLCQSISRSDWRCDPAGDSVAPGTMVLYTRVRSPRDGVIVHRWYQGDALRKSAQLRTAANAAEGYRTYSQQTVDPGEWRVEVR